MSSTSNTTSSSSHFNVLLNAALTKYTEQTGNDLRDHPLASRIDSCDSAESILDIFQEQATEFDEFRKSDNKLFKWLAPVVKVLHALSTNKALSEHASLVSPANVFLTFISHSRTLFPLGISTSQGGFLWYRDPSIRECLPLGLRGTPGHIRNCQTATYVRSSYDALVDIFECVESFLGRLSIYTRIPAFPATTESVIPIMVELLSVLGLATKQIQQGPFSTCVLA